MSLTQPGDLIQLVGRDHKYTILRLVPGRQLQTHEGVLNHDDLIGQPWGAEVRSHNDHPFYVLPPALSDIVFVNDPASTEIYPKDLG